MMVQGQNQGMKNLFKANKQKTVPYSVQKSRAKVDELTAIYWVRKCAAAHIIVLHYLLFDL